ncbi:MAG TPA: outer membrane lipoprotein-sorting protein [Bacillota bacterium]
MKKLVVIFLGLLFLTLNLQSEAASDVGTDLLKKSDAIIFPDQCKFLFRLEDYEKDRSKRYSIYQGYMKGDNRYLLIGLEPALVKGTAQLRIDETIFNYLKKVDVLQQVSAKVAFGNSTLSEEDVMGGKLENYYKVSNLVMQEEKGKQVAVLTITAKSKDVAYHKIINYLDPVSCYPVKRLYYSFSGKQVREMVFETIQMKNGKLDLLKFTMYDSLRRGWYSKVTINNFDYSKTIPDNIFTRMYLKLATK